MKKLTVTLIAGALACCAASAVVPVNKGKYVLVPTDAAAAATGGHFVACGPDNSLVLTDEFGAGAVWKWTYVSGTTTVAGHYAMSSLDGSAWLFTTGADGIASVSESDVAVTRSAGTVVGEASMFKADGMYLTTTAGGSLIGSAEAVAASEFLVMAYDATLTADQMLERAKAESELVAARAAREAELRKYFNASATGRRYADMMLADIAGCTTAEELSAAVLEARRTAIRMFESDFENGSTWQQLTSGLYVTFADGAYRGVEAVSTDGLWYAEFTDNGNSVIENRKFYLRSNRTKRYLALAGDGSTAVADVSSRSAATLWRVVTNPEGLAVAVDADAANASLLYPGADGVLGVHTGADAPQAAASLDEIATFGEGVLSVFVSGPEAPGSTSGVVGAPVFAGINRMEITVNHGAVPQADGEIRLILRSSGTSGIAHDNELLNLSAATLPEPETRTVEVNYFDSKGNYISRMAEVDVYTVDLGTTYTDGGEYIARVSLGSFMLDGAINYEFSSYSIVTLSGLWELEITPAAGNVDALTEICISGPDGVYANKDAEADTFLRLRVDSSSGMTVDLLECTVGDFAQGGKYDSYDIMADDPVWFTIPCDCTAPGRYVLVIPRGFFVDNHAHECAEMTLFWLVGEQGSILETGVTDSAAGRVVCDLQGRPVKSMVPGRVYIMDGKKIIR